MLVGKCSCNGLLIYLLVPWPGAAGMDWGSKHIFRNDNIQSILNYFDAILYAETNESIEGHATNLNEAYKTEQT